ncbi:hypothetical protein TNCV_2072361 [Trichonephila clavipes]|nr:hypothetical protein TNCV_2072361 [Trichonephila clavipes]
MPPWYKNFFSECRPGNRISTVNAALGKWKDLLELATELGLEATVDMIKPMLKNLITKSAGYDEEDSKLMYEGIVEERKERELLEERKRRDNLELE